MLDKISLVTLLAGVNLEITFHIRSQNKYGLMVADNISEAPKI